MSKPFIVYIEEEEDSSFASVHVGNPKREGLSYFLRKNCDCEVVNYEDGL